MQGSCRRIHDQGFIIKEQLDKAMWFDGQAAITDDQHQYCRWKPKASTTTKER